MHRKAWQENGSKYLLQGIFSPKLGKSTYTQKRKGEWFLIIDIFLFFVKSKCYKSKTDKLYVLNGYIIPAKEHQVVDRWAVDHISVSEILSWKSLEYAP